MIVVLKPGCAPEARDSLVSWLTSRGLEAHVSVSGERTVIGLIGDVEALDCDLLRSLDTVESVARVSDPFKSANRRFHPDDTVVNMGDGALVGGGNFALIAGPCSVESREQICSIAAAVKAAGLHLAVETAGAVSPDRIRAAAPYVDLWLYDVKDTDAERLKAMTGGDLDRITDNLRLCDSVTGGTIRLRCIMVRGVNMDDAHYAGIAALYRGLAHAEGVDLLPYHAYAGSKAERVGLPDNGRREWIPTAEDMERAGEALRTQGVRLS